MSLYFSGYESIFKKLNKGFFMSRPTIYSDELADDICDRILEGESLRSIGNDPKMPSLRTLAYWKRDKKEFLHKYTYARQTQAEIEFDDIKGLASTATPETLACIKLLVDTHKWNLSKVLPKVCGDKLDLNHTGKMEVTKITRNIVE
jgi:hypothetical protein